MFRKFDPTLQPTLFEFTGTTVQQDNVRSIPSSMELAKNLGTMQRENLKPQSEEGISSEVKQRRINLNSIQSIIRRLRRSPKDRTAFVASHIDKGIAYQVRALREAQNFSQEKLAEMVGMNQNAISRIESPERGRPTITTLKRLAAAFDVALVVRFVPFSQLASWVSGTPFVDRGLSTGALAVPSFPEEDKEGTLDRQIEASGIVGGDDWKQELEGVPAGVYARGRIDPADQIKQRVN